MFVLFHVWVRGCSAVCPRQTNPCFRMIMSWRKGTVRVMEKEKKTLTHHASDGTDAAIDHNYSREEGMSLC